MHVTICITLSVFPNPYSILFAEGPYLISCNDGLAFLKVVQEINGQATVMATTKIEQVSQFYVILTDEGTILTSSTLAGKKVRQEKCDI